MTSNISNITAQLAPVSNKEFSAARKVTNAAVKATKAAEKAAADKLQAEFSLVYVYRRERRLSPEGKFDGRGRWYPSERESSSYLRSIRSPSAAWPYSLLKAACTRAHVAALRDENPEYFAELLAEAEQLLVQLGGQELADYLERGHQHLCLYIAAGVSAAAI